METTPACFRTYNFGYGSMATQQASSVTHTYQSAGTFTALLNVIDSNGLASSNTASVVISIAHRFDP